MLTTMKAIVFLLLTFVFSWGATLLGANAGLNTQPVAAKLILTAMMAGPALAALICTFAFEQKGRRVDALGLRFKPNWWWLWAFVIVVAIAAISVGVTAVASPFGFSDPAPNYVAVVVQQLSPEKAAEVRAVPLPLIDLGLAINVLIGAFINAVILTFTEELGWRGYLYALWRPSGFWRSALATGFIWGVWHAPAIYLYGLNYEGHREIGIPIFVAYCTLLGPLMALIRDRGGSTWAAGIAHGTINALGGVTILCLANPAFPWMGIVGIGGFVALALALVGVNAARRGLAPAATGA